MGNWFKSNLINKERDTKDTAAIKHHFQDLNIKQNWRYGLFETKNQPRYAVVVIDIFSIYGDAQPMHNNGNRYVYDALWKSFKIMKYPMAIYSDDDSAFKTQVE